MSSEDVSYRRPARFDASRFASRADWESRAEPLRGRIASAVGFIPMPARNPLNVRRQVVRIEPDHIIEQISFESLAGAPVTASLYRPRHQTSRVPGLLHAHGHWKGGRLGLADEAAIEQALGSGAERHRSGAMAPLQASSVTLARMGAVVLLVDLVGFGQYLIGDHATGLKSDDALRDGVTLMSIQVWNCIRALDVLESLDEVDPARLGMFGASGGGSLTILTGAIDPRVRASAVAGMVSSDMQGGCHCENAPSLRIDSNNVELASLHAPRPLCVVSAEDWTKRFGVDDLPAMRSVYRLFDAERSIEHTHIAHPHNFNVHTREAITAFFARTLELDAPKSAEGEFEPVRPGDMPEVTGLKDLAGTVEQFKRQRTQALQAMDEPRRRGVVLDALRGPLALDGSTRGESRWLAPADAARWNGEVIVACDGTDEAVVELIRARGSAVVLLSDDGVDPPSTSPWRGMDLCYHRTAPAERAKRLVDAVRGLQSRADVRRIRLLGLGERAGAVLLARVVLGSVVHDAVADFTGALDDPMPTPAFEAIDGWRGVIRAGAGLSMLISGAPASLLDPPMPPTTIDVRKPGIGADDIVARLVGRKPRLAGVPMPDVLTHEFLYESAPFPSCHAATLLETDRGTMLASFFGGTHERHPDVCIYVSRRGPDGWAAPQAVADGVQPDGSRLPTWNPVLFQPRNGPVMLFYKVGPNPRDWWGMVITSDDDGRSWSPPVRLAEGLLGPIKNKPVQLPEGSVVSPTSIESAEHGWRVYFERSVDSGTTWTPTPWVESDPSIRAIQPSVLIHSPSRLQAIGRTKSGRLFETWSEDAGVSWSPLALTSLPNCNSGTDAVTLADGRHLLIYNHATREKERYPLNLAISRDGRVWHASTELESEPPGQYSYPCVIQSQDGRVHVAYTWKRLKMRYAVLDPRRMPLGERAEA